jgi:hypothetical protein
MMTTLGGCVVGTLGTAGDCRLCNLVLATLLAALVAPFQRRSWQKYEQAVKALAFGHYQCGQMTFWLSNFNCNQLLIMFWLSTMGGGGGGASSKAWRVNNPKVESKTKD